MTGKKTVHKWFWVWEFEKEEQWLNAMAQSGWLLDKVSFCTYHFIACVPGEYTVRLEMHSYDEAYIRFMQETGAEYIGHVLQWAYFRKKTECGTFNIFSDLDSRIEHLDRISSVITLIVGANLVIGLANEFDLLHFGWINLLCAALAMYALGRIHEKRELLQKKRMLLE